MSDKQRPYTITMSIKGWCLDGKEPTPAVVDELCRSLADRLSTHTGLVAPLWEADISVATSGGGES